MAELSVQSAERVVRQRTTRLHRRQSFAVV